MRMTTYWICEGKQKNPFHCVRLPQGKNDREVKREALRQVDVVPGIVCEQWEAPCERRVRIIQGTVKQYYQRHKIVV